MPSTPPPDELLDRAAAHFDQISMSAVAWEDFGPAVGVTRAEFEEAFPDRASFHLAIMDRIYALEKVAEEDTATGASDLDAYLDGVLAAFEWNLDPEHHALRRLEFQIAGFERRPWSVQRFYRHWLTAARTDLIALGLSESDAAIEARIINNLYNGFLYDVVVNGDAEAAREAFATAIDRYRSRLKYLVELA